MGVPGGCPSKRKPGPSAAISETTFRERLPQDGASLHRSQSVIVNAVAWSAMRVRFGIQPGRVAIMPSFLWFSWTAFFGSLRSGAPSCAVPASFVLRWCWWHRWPPYPLHPCAPCKPLNLARARRRWRWSSASRRNSGRMDRRRPSAPSTPVSSTIATFIPGFTPLTGRCMSQTAPFRASVARTCTT